MVRKVKKKEHKKRSLKKNKEVFLKDLPHGYYYVKRDNKNNLPTKNVNLFLGGIFLLGVIFYGIVALKYIVKSFS